VSDKNVLPPFAALATSLTEVVAPDGSNVQVLVMASGQVWETRFPSALYVPVNDPPNPESAIEVGSWRCSVPAAHPIVDCPTCTPPEVL